MSADFLAKFGIEEVHDAWDLSPEDVLRLETIRLLSERFVRAFSLAWAMKLHDDPEAIAKLAERERVCPVALKCAFGHFPPVLWTEEQYCAAVLYGATP